MSYNCAGFHFVEKDGVYYVVGVVDDRFPEVKIPGGGGKITDKTHDDTLIREFKEETDGALIPTKFKVIHQEEKPGHTKLFFLVTEISGKIYPGEGMQVNEPDGEILTVRLWNIKEFEAKLFRNYRIAFIKAFLAMANLDEKFRHDNLEMFTRFSAMKF